MLKGWRKEETHPDFFFLLRKFAKHSALIGRTLGVSLPSSGESSSCSCREVLSLGGSRWVFQSCLLILVNLVNLVNVNLVALSKISLRVCHF